RDLWRFRASILRIWIFPRLYLIKPAACRVRATTVTLMRFTPTFPPSIPAYWVTCFRRLDLDFGGSVALAQSCHTVRIDIEPDRSLLRRGSFSQASSSPYIQCRSGDGSAGSYRRLHFSRIFVLEG